MTKRASTSLLPTSKAAAYLGLHASTLRRYERDGKITSVRINDRGDRRFKVADLDLLRSDGTEAPKRAAIYTRVSGRGDQLSSLAVQKVELEAALAEQGFELVSAFSDIGSGLAEKRRGLARMLAAAADQRFDVVLVTHEDRLARFGVAWIRQLLAISGVELVVLHAKAGGSAEEELVTDFVSLVASFSGRLYGQRSADTKRRLLERVASTPVGSDG